MNASHLRPWWKYAIIFLPVLLLVILAIYLVATREHEAATPTLAKELIFADWEGDMPQSVLDAFTREFGVKVIYEIYQTQEGMLDKIHAGQQVDVLVLESRFVPQAKEDGLLRRISYQNVTNFKNISANFRGLAYDPENEYSIPFNWGTTGLVVREDLVEAPVTRWADLWDKRYTGRTAIWLYQTREVIGIALKSLGYSANSENEQELQAALAKLIELKQHVIYLEDYDSAYSGEAMASGQIVLSMGYAGDVFAGRKLNEKITYVYPEEGALLWGDNFVIPSNSPNPTTAEVFINFLLRPDINAQIANENYYATPNEAALAFIDPQILNDRAIFPPSATLKNMEIILPLSSQGQELYARIWKQFIAAEPTRQP
jgi:spermidine/putrescine transport system substrate-binding protein